MRCKQELLSNMCFAPLGDLLAEPLRNGLTKPKAVRGDGVKMIGMGEIFANSRIGSISMARVPVTEKELSNNCIKKGDILFARQSLALEGAGKCAIVIDVTEETVFESHLIRARIDSSKANPYFVYYYFNSYAGKENIKTIVEQVAAAGIRGGDLIRLNVPCPDIETQNKIAAILSALDEKIATNRAINDNLEQQAFALFDSLFPRTIDGSQTIGDYINPKRGRNLLSKDAVYGTVPVVAGGLEPSTYHNVANTKAPVLTISASGANAGFVNLWLNPVWSSDSSYIDSSMTPNVFFWYILLKGRQKEIFDAQTGSAQPHIYPQHIAAMPIGNLNQESVSQFTTQVAPLFELIGANKDENERLRNIRDALLPRLMSGEIDVTDICI